MNQLFHHPLLIRLSVIAVLLVGAVAFLPGFSSIPPMDRDESRFAQASRQMVESGDLVTVRFQHELRAKKPVGIYWMQAASAAAFGTDTIAPFRLPSLIGALLVAGLGFMFARSMIPPAEAAMAGIFMASSLVLAAESHLAKTDAMLAAAILIQQWALWRIYQLSLAEEYVNGRLALTFWGAMGAAVLIKGPLAPLIALLTVAVLCINERNWRWTAGLRPVIGFITLVVIILPWVLLVTHATDGEFLSTAIKGDLVGKIQAGQESHGAPPLTHLALLVITFWPGSLLLARGIIGVWPRWRQRETIFLLGWVVPFWMVIELTPTKLPHYFLPVMPGLAMLLALGIGAALPKARPRPPAIDGASPMDKTFSFIKSLHPVRVLVFGWEALFMLVSVALGIFVLYGATDLGGSRFWGAMALALGVAVAALAFWWSRQQKPAILVLMAMAGAMFHAVTFGGVLPSLSDMHVAPRLKAAISTLEGPVESIAAAGYHEPSMVFTLGTETLLFTAPETALFLAEAPNGLAIVESRAKAEFLETAAKAGITVVETGAIRGYNASRGQRIELEFYRAAD